MPKLKTSRSAAKRFYKLSAKGKVRTVRPGKSHLNVKKSRRRLRRLSEPRYFEGKEVARIKKYVPYL